MKNIANYMKDGWIFHYDDNGQPEFGDGTSRFGLKWFPIFTQIDAVFFKRAFIEGYVAAFERDEPVRYPFDDTKWYGKTGFMSRDNTIPCLSCLAVLGETILLRSFLKRIAGRGGFLWNTKHIGQQDNKWKIPDWCGISLIALIARGEVASENGLMFLISYLFYLPFLVLADVFLLLSAIFRIIKLYLDADDCGDCINLICLMSAIRETKTETPLSFLARMIYSGLHPGAGPSNQARMRGYGPLTSFKHYFAGDKNPPIDDLWAEYLIKRF